MIPGFLPQITQINADCWFLLSASICAISGEFFFSSGVCMTENINLPDIFTASNHYPTASWNANQSFTASA